MGAKVREVCEKFGISSKRRESHGQVSNSEMGSGWSFQKFALAAAAWRALDS